MTTESSPPAWSLDREQAQARGEAAGWTWKFIEDLCTARGWQHVDLGTGARRVTVLGPDTGGAELQASSDDAQVVWTSLRNTEWLWQGGDAS